MGSVASYSAEVMVRYKRDINGKTPNTDKDIEYFLKLKGVGGSVKTSITTLSTLQDGE